MKMVVERVIKDKYAKVRAWLPTGQLETIYFSGPQLHTSPAKYFVRDRKNNKVRVVEGTLYQNMDTGVPYFLP
jgi:hypothetical protein